jgi:hypothetical protein
MKRRRRRRRRRRIIIRRKRRRRKPNLIGESLMIVIFNASMSFYISDF